MADVDDIRHGRKQAKLELMRQKYKMHLLLDYHKA